MASQIGMWWHECGHYIVAKYIDYQTQIVYNYTYWGNSKTKAFEDSIFFKHHKGKELENSDFPGKQKFLDAVRKENSDDFWITLAGPLETMLTGTIGFILLLLYKTSLQTTKELIFKQ